ncbi:MAG: aminotransferase class IV [Acidimicrobiales bacterium]
MTKVFVNGSLVSPQEALISVFDHGLVAGDGVFETILLHRHRPFALRRHLDRLQRSASGLGIHAPSSDDVADAIDQVVESSDFDVGRIRVTVTSGTGPLGSARGNGPATLVVAAEPFDLYRDAAAVAVVPWTRNVEGGITGLKTTSYAENARALQFAHDKGADEAIFANSAEMLCEGTGSNVFVVIGGELVTPPLTAGCLDGVTRQLVLEHHGGDERDVSASQFITAQIDEAFLTSTLRGVQPIASIDGFAPREVGAKQTQRAAAAYSALLESDDDI